MKEISKDEEVLFLNVHGGELHGTQPISAYYLTVTQRAFINIYIYFITTNQAYVYVQ